MRLLPPWLLVFPTVAGRFGRRRFAWSPRWTLLTWLLLLAPALPLRVPGVERFPPPEFEAGYVMPPTTTPAPRAGYLEYLDTVILVAALGLASYLVLQQRRRRTIAGLMLFSLAYFGFYRKGCICPVGSLQDVALALGHTGYQLPWTVLAFFMLPLLFTLFFGRTFCAAVCPLGAMQDVMLAKPIPVRPWLEHALGILPWIYLGAAVLFAVTGSAFLICQYDPFVSLFRRSGSLNILLWSAAVLLLATVVGRPYCRFLCPYGALLGLCSRFAKWNVTLSPHDCIRCQLCEVACPFGAIQEPSPKNASPRRVTAPGQVIGFGLLLVGLVVGGVFLAKPLAPTFSLLHPTVALAERVAAEDAGQFTEPTDASQAFRQTGRPVEDLYGDALKIRGQFEVGTSILGGFVGLVFGLKLLSLCFLKLPASYEPDPATCLACGRCYTYCPKEIVRQKRYQRERMIPITPAPQSGPGPAPQSPA